MNGIYKFVRRSGGTGTVISTTYLSRDMSLGSPAYVNVRTSSRAITDGVLDGVEVDSFYFGNAPLTSHQSQSVRRDIQSRVALIKQELIVRDFTLVQMPRGRAKLLNIHDNFGDVVSETPSGDVVILANCTCREVSVEDDEGIHGARFAIRFFKVSPANAP
ncbi:hypothetical protein UFOVP329_35 [uncultured Caudovirales phage]|jgi:hypothetical protein|uniref:Uncharacterized protein n=1 Tax=uncultured Caudovirales phage TaxID=2100421 RepID=A0A6J5LYQ5_9CAUD|nr:hypothetical protein UFOVP329_35 [uncultured Caudovirales phage]